MIRDVSSTQGEDNGLEKSIFIKDAGIEQWTIKKSAFILILLVYCVTSYLSLTIYLVLLSDFDTFELI